MRWTERLAASCLSQAIWWCGVTWAAEPLEPMVQLSEPECRASAVRVAEALRASALWTRGGPPEQLVVESSALSAPLADLMAREMARALGVNLPRSETPTVANHVALRLRWAGTERTRRAAIDVFWRGELGGPPLWTFTHLVPSRGNRTDSPDGVSVSRSSPSANVPARKTEPRSASARSDDPSPDETDIIEEAAPVGRPVGTLPAATARLEFDRPRDGYWPAQTGVVYTLDPSLASNFTVSNQQGGMVAGSFTATATLRSKANRAIRVRHFVTVLDVHGRYIDESPRVITLVPPGGELVLTHTTRFPAAALYMAVLDSAK